MENHRRPGDLQTTRRSRRESNAKALPASPLDAAGGLNPSIDAQYLKSGLRQIATATMPVTDNPEATAVRGFDTTITLHLPERKSFARAMNEKSENTVVLDAITHEVCDAS